MSWFRREKRSAGSGGGDFYNAVLATIDAQAATKAAHAGGTAAIEAAAGQLARTFASATVKAPQWAQDAITPAFLAQVGRDLIRGGASLHRIDAAAGAVRLIPVAQWFWAEGRTADPSTWRVRTSDYGPAGSETRLIDGSGVIWATWGLSATTPWVGQGPTAFAGLTARLAANAEATLADELGGPVAQLLPVPTNPDGTDADDADKTDDPLAPLRTDVSKARGAALLVETTSSGWAEGKANAPQRDWVASRLGPEPPDAVRAAAQDAFSRMLAACGTPPALFDPRADGTAQRESLRRYHLATVLPFARLLEVELSAKLDTEVLLSFDNYPLDLQGRAAAFRAMVTAGVAVERALAITGLVSLGDD